MHFKVKIIRGHVLPRVKFCRCVGLVIFFGTVMLIKIYIHANCYQASIVTYLIVC